MIIEKEDGRLIELARIERDLKEQSERKLYIWGCCCTAGMITEFCRKNSRIHIAAYVVDDLYYKEEVYLGKQVLKASDWTKTVASGDYVIFGFTGAAQAEELRKKLPVGVRGVYFHFPYSANVAGTSLDYAMYKEHEDQFERLYANLADVHSQRVLEAFINGCVSGNVEELEKLKTEKQYFNSLTRNFQVKCFVDCGAYVGDTIEAAKEFYPQSLAMSVAFEPDRNNAKLLQERMHSSGISAENLHLLTKGSWKEAGVLHFSSSNSSSSITEAGDIEIEVDSIDHVMSTMQQVVDFIKIDVEGSEKETLLGAVRTIQKDQPILAVCVYHKPEDLLVLPEIIRNMVKEHSYEYYLRYHGPNLRELVLYAIPVKKR